MTKQIITQTELKYALGYSPITGIFTWINPYGHVVKSGDVAGSLDKDGYVLISIKGKRYPAHRLAWLYIYGEMPKNKIDHKNRIRIDNRILNLREADNYQNARNAGLSKNNSTGFKGVYFCKRANKFVATVFFNKKRLYLGSSKTLESASGMYKAFAKENHGEYAAV